MLGFEELLPGYRRLRERMIPRADPAFCEKPLKLEFGAHLLKPTDAYVDIVVS